MIIALSRFTIANGMTEEVRAAFGNRAHLGGSAAGFLGWLLQLSNTFRQPNTGQARRR